MPKYGNNSGTIISLMFFCKILLITYLLKLSEVLASRPNIVLFMADDLPADLIPPSLPKSTPLYDLFAEFNTNFIEKSTTFNGYTVHPVCGPSRYSILFGRTTLKGQIDRFFEEPRESDPLQKSIFRFAKEQDYITKVIGKIFHDANPLEFTEDLGTKNDTTNNLLIMPEGANGECKSRMLYCILATKKSRDYKIANAAISWIQSYLNTEQKNPFFLGVGFHRPHIPFTTDIKTLTRIRKALKNTPITSRLNFFYKNKYDFAKNEAISYWHNNTISNFLPLEMDPDMFDAERLEKSDYFYAAIKPGESKINKKGKTINQLGPGKYGGIMSAYKNKAFITNLETYVRASTLTMIDQFMRVFNFIEKEGLLYNTYIIFQSDHGQNFFTRDLFTKNSPDERTLRVPLIIYDPLKKLPAGYHLEKPISTINIAKTICEIIGSNCKDQSSIDLDGSSIFQLIKTPTQSREYVLTFYPRCQPKNTIQDDPCTYFQSNNGSTALIRMLIVVHWLNNKGIQEVYATSCNYEVNYSHFGPTSTSPDAKYMQLYRSEDAYWHKDYKRTMVKDVCTEIYHYRYEIDSIMQNLLFSTDKLAQQERDLVKEYISSEISKQQKLKI